MRTSKFSVDQKVKFRGQSYKLKGDKRWDVVVVKVEFDESIHAMTYDVRCPDGEIARKCYEDMLEAD